MALKDVASKLAVFYQKIEGEKLNNERYYIKSRLEEKINEIEKAIKPIEGRKNQPDKEKQCITEVKQKVKKLWQLIGKLEDKFSIFVIGDGNVGKSTVVNALLGQEVAKMKFDPMTWKLDIFNDEATEEAEIVSYDRKGNISVKLPIEEAKALIDQEELKRDESIERIQKAIEEKTTMIAQVCKAQHIPYREVADKLEAYKERVWREELYTSDIIEARWPVSANELLRNFQVVDTPGLRQNRIETRLQDSIKKYYDEADGIIWVLDMNKIATNSTKAYIEQIKEELFIKDKACEQKRIVALLNRSDCIKTEQEKDAVLNQARMMYGEEFSEILPFSAIKALKGQLQGDKGLLKESGYMELDSYIKRHFLQGAHEVKIQGLLKEIQKEEIKFQVLISYYIQELEEHLSQYREDNKKLAMEFETVEQEILERLESMFLSYEHTVMARIEKFTEVLFDITESKENVLKEHILNITGCEREFKELLQGLLKKVKRIKEAHFKKEHLNNMSVSSIETFIESINFMQYFKELEEALELEKLEENPIRKLVSGISVVKKMVDKPYIEQCKEILAEGLGKVIESIYHEVVEEIKTILLKEKRLLLEMRQYQFDEIYGNDQGRVSQLYALKTIEKILAEPTRESTLVDYIKGKGEIKWNNI